jgi:hypothetical protein
VGALTQQLLQVASEPDVLRRWAEQAGALALTRAWATTGQRFAGHFQRTAERAPRQHSI